MVSGPSSLQGAPENNYNNDGNHEVAHGNLKYVSEQAGNGSAVAYQEASGAPVEVESPLGYSVGAVTIIFLNLSKMVGTGIYSTRELDAFRQEVFVKQANSISLNYSPLHWICRRCVILLVCWFRDFDFIA